jgi:hypothetical protein
VADAESFSLHRNSIVSGRQRNPKMSLIVGGERSHLARLAFHYESSIRERLGTGTISSDWSGLSRTNRNGSFNPRVHAGGSLSDTNASSQNKEPQNNWESRKSHS